MVQWKNPGANAAFGNLLRTAVSMGAERHGVADRQRPPHRRAVANPELPASAMMEMMLRLELDGRVERLPGQYYARR